MVWRPGQREPFAIAETGSQGARTSGCYVAFIYGRPEDGALLIEDGFVVELTTASWVALARAVGDGTDLSIPTTGRGMSFALEWLDEAYVSPIDGAVYHAAGGWQTYLPTGDADLAHLAAPGDGIRLLTAQATIEARCSASDLATFCEEVRRCMERTLARSNGPTKVLVRMTCTPAGHRVALASQGTAEPEVLRELRDALGARSVERLLVVLQPTEDPLRWRACGVSLMPSGSRPATSFFRRANARYCASLLLARYAREPRPSRAPSR